MYDKNTFGINVLRFTCLPDGRIYKAKFRVLMITIVELFCHHASVSEFKYRMYGKQRAKLVCNTSDPSVSAEIIKVSYEKLSYHLAAVLCKLCYYLIGR